MSTKGKFTPTHHLKRVPSPCDRIAWAEGLAVELETHAEQLAQVIASQTGKPLRFSRSEVQRSVIMIRANSARFQAHCRDEQVGSARLRRRPVGTIAVVTPANNPVYIPLSKLVPAMLYGNSAIWKPAEEVTAISQQIIIAMSKVQWPQSLVQLREGGRHEADKLFNDPSVDAVTITGSEAAGEAARTVCARRNIPLQAELGGNNAALVWDDADLNAAAQAIAGGAFDMAGQRCTANRRVIVHQDCMDRFLPLLVSATRELGWGDPLSPKTRVGPLLTPSRRQRVASAVERAAEHASCIFPLSSLSPQTSSFTGCWFPPTIIRCDDAQAEIVQEETFGPVLVVQSANEWDQAIELANGVRQGLVAAIFSTSPDMIELFLDQAQAGMLKVNQATADAEVDVPFCAWKASGSGPPEHGEFNREFYSRPQVVYDAA